MTDVIDVRNYQNRLSPELIPDMTVYDKKLTTLFWHSELAGKLSDSDNRFLDQLTNNQHKLFLVKNNKFLYPSGFDLIKPSEIESELYNTSNAFFSYNLHLENGKIVNISTSPINASQSNRMTLGLIIPMDHANSPEIEDQLLTIGKSFRDKYSSIQKDILTVRSALESENAVIIISRETGNIITVNEPARQYIPISENDLLSIKFSHLQKILTQSHPNLMFNIANLHSTNSDVSIVTLATRESLDTKDDDSSLFITEQMTNHLSHVMLAYSDLMENFKANENDENVQLIESSLGELTKINQFIRMYNLLHKIEKIESERVHLLSHLEYSIDTTAPETIIQNDELLEDEVVCAPKDSIRILFETSLAALQSNKSSKSDINIFCYNDTNPKLIFTINNIQLGRIRMFKNYFSLLKELSTKIGIIFTHTIDQNNQTIALTITFAKGETK